MEFVLWFLTNMCFSIRFFIRFTSLEYLDVFLGVQNVTDASLIISKLRTLPRFIICKKKLF